MRDNDIQRRDQSRAMTQQGRGTEQGEWQGYVQPYRYYGPGYRGVGYYAVFYQGPEGSTGGDQGDNDEPQTQFDQRNVQYGQGQGSGWGWQGRGRHGRGSSEPAGAWNDRARQFGQFAGRGPKGYQRSDERIREDVSDRLMEHPELDASGLEVVVEAGVVTLTGDVDSRWAKRLAEEIAEEVGGVRDVMNHLSVSSGQGGQSDQSGREMRSASQTGGSQTRGTTEATASASQPRNGRRSSTATAER